MEAASRTAAAAGGDWRSQIHAMARAVMVKKIMRTLKKHLPMTDPEGLSRLENIANKYEEKFYNTAPSQTSYSRKIAMLLLYVENQSQNHYHRGNNPAESSGVSLMSQQEILQGNNSASVQVASAPSSGQNSSNISQTSALQDISRQFSLPQMQLMVTHSGTQSGIQQNPFNIVQQPILPLCQQPPQCVEGQQQNLQPSMHQQLYLQQTLLTQHPSIHLQQQQERSTGAQTNLHQNQLIFQANSLVEMQQQQRLPVQSNNHSDLDHPNNLESFTHNPQASLGCTSFCTPLSSEQQQGISGNNAHWLVMDTDPEIETDTPFPWNEDTGSDEVQNALRIEDLSSEFDVHISNQSQGHGSIDQDDSWWNDQPFLTPIVTEEVGWLASQDLNCVSMANGATNSKKRKLDVPSSSAPEPTFPLVDNHSFQ